MREMVTLSSTLGVLECPLAYAENFRRWADDMFADDPEEIQRHAIFVDCWNQTCEAHTGWWELDVSAGKHVRKFFERIDYAILRIKHSGWWRLE